MASQDPVLCIDIGGDSIKVAEFSYPQGGGVVLEKFSFCEYGGDMKEEELSGALSDAIRDTILENGFRARKVAVSLSGQSAFTRFTKLSLISDDESKIRQVVEFEAKQNIPFPMDEVVWDYQLIANADENADMEALLVVVKNEVIDGITKVIEEIGKEIVLIEVAPTASFNSGRANNVGDKDCEMMLNIGGRVSTLVFVDNGRFFVRTIPIAGNTVTQQISKEFGIPFADAEEMKRRHGFVALGGAYEEPDSEVAATVSKIVRNVMTRLHGEINRSINFYRSQQKGRKPEKLYLAGGSSVMAFTPRFFSEKLRIPVEYFNPFKVVALAQGIDKENLAEVAHMFSEVIGLGLRFVTVCPIEISLVPEAIKKQNEFRTKLPYFYAAAGSVLLCLLVTFWGFSKQESMVKTKLKAAQEKVTATSNMLRQVETAEGERKMAERQFLDAKALLDDRAIWINLMNELQSQLPDNIWYSKIRGSSTSSAADSQASNARAQQDFGRGGIFDPFGGGPKRGQSAGATASTIEWISLEGHSYVGKDTRLWEDVLMGNLQRATKYFTGRREDIVISSLEPARGTNNVSSFKFDVKLKTPINKK